MSGSFVSMGLSSLVHLRSANILLPQQQRQISQRQLHVVRAQGDEDTQGSSSDPLKPDMPNIPRRRRRRRSAAKDAEPESFSLDNLNPYSMGKKSREVFDEVWTQLQRIGGPSRSVAPENVPFELDAPEAYESPLAADTTVLVTGATGRVGRVLTRKLLLRGYKVRALVRRRGEDLAPENDAIPQVVEIVYGDIGDYKACRKAVEGVDKVICCSAARTTLTADLNRVDDTGVTNLARAFLDARNAAARKSGTVAPSSKIDVADFQDETYHPLWDVEHVGPPDLELAKTGYYAQSRRRNKNQAQDMAEAYIDEDDSLVFEGAVYSRDGYAQVGAPLQELPHGKSLSGTEGLVIRLLGDAHQYSAVVETADARTYTARFPTRTGYSTIRLPWNTFLAGKDVEDGCPLDPTDVSHISLRFEPKMKVLEQVTEPGQSMFDSAGNRFKLGVDWIKALPGGEETDFVLVSCAGAKRSGLEDGDRDRITAAKRRGEAALRNSGLGYTIVRPGPLAEEAGGYKALVFDQGNRITEKVACADVADVCLKALHDGLARNKTFEVCWEYTPEEGLESWDLLCHFPDKSTGYLTQALSPLQKNT
jgi:uncharacterized protein YbjT (DUF2867 family)